MFDRKVTISFSDYAETSSDYAYSVVAGLKKFYILKFQNGLFNIHQTEDTYTNIPKPSITDDHKYIVLGDETSFGTFLFQIYVFDEGTLKFNKGDSYNFENPPMYASLSPSK